jgi:hypothetical protein
MINLTAGTTNTPSSIPFWLQIASIAAAPVLGFAGIAIGIMLSERNRRTAYFIEEKKKAYLDFINTLTVIHSFWTDEMTTILQKPDDQTADKIGIYSKSHIERLERTYAQILLFGSESVVEVGGRCFTYLVKTSMTAMIMAAKGLDRKRWPRVTGEIIGVMNDFSRVARKDLGLPELPQGEYKPSKYLEEIADKIIEITEPQVKKNPKSGTPRHKTRLADRLRQHRLTLKRQRVQRKRQQ